MDEKVVNQPNQSFFVVIVGILVVVGLIVGFIFMQNRPVDSSDNEGEGNTFLATNTPKSTQSPAPTLKVMPTGSEVTADGEVKEIQVEAGSFYFSPKEIRVKKGQTVRVILTSKDMMHNFVIDEFDVMSPVTVAGNTSTIEFVANEVGEFEFYCSVGQHRQMGQVGKLIVE